MRPILPNLEIITPTFGSSFSITKYDNNDNNKIAYWHYHPEIELVYINGGSGKRQVGSHLSYFNDGDLLLIGSNLPHCGFTNEVSRNKKETVIQMKPDFLGTDFFDISEMTNIKNLFNQAKLGMSFVGKTKNTIGKKIEALEEQSQLVKLLNLLEILNELDQSDESVILNAEGISLEIQMQDNDRINVVYNFVKDHFQENISLEEVATLVFMTVPSFCRFFKKATNKTFVKFVNDYRLVHASKLLAEKTIGVAEVCIECGFNNFSHFNKSFKEFTGQSAYQYRQDLKTILE
ncbi:AraC family transcriptional regulator [Flavobacterium cellulosilyticum]|uniref:AraC family transcriptional regulator n=1 Tax=Flavobacterium cellulosilyticum TaxID=2541731 RepID=A0A4R5CJL4_9FLAO|nr:AraC family transcriptional regulator [Flavobacterium cellulosilyticum]TDD99346.1 AraC family transcriptional regulator [Flavobacterium cellulosilyticum]